MSGPHLDVALVHHLAPGGGAWRVLVEYVARRPQHRFTVYTRLPEPPPGEVLVPLPPQARVRRFPLPQPQTPAGRLRALRALRRRGRELAAIIDAAGHDVAFVHASQLVQSHEVLPHLRTPSLAYAPEPLRAAYEPPVPFGPAPGIGERLARVGLHPYERLRRRLDCENLPAAGRVVTHSRFTRAQLRRIYGVDAAVVPLGVDADAFAPARDMPRTPSVLSVGALHPLKGHHFVIEALATIEAAQRPPLVVAGERGALAGSLRELAARRRVDLELLHAVSLPQLVARFGAAAVVACGQIREPFGLVPLEAMAAGTPVVAVEEGGLAETVEHGATGLLTARDPAAFGAAVARVLEDAALAHRLREGGLRAVRDRWGWERTAAGYDALLLEELGRATSAAPR